MTEPQATTKKSNRKTRVGIVVSDSQAKTVIVRVDRRAAHPKYQKVITRSKRYHVHDEHKEARLGDRVEIIESRPLSRLKRWRLAAILQRKAH